MSEKAIPHRKYPHWFQEHTEFLPHINPNASPQQMWGTLTSCILWNIHYSVSWKNLPSKLSNELTNYGTGIPVLSLLAHRKAANTEEAFFCLKDKNKGRDSLPEIRDRTSWDGGRNTTRLLVFAKKPHEERAKANIGNQRNPKGRRRRIWGWYWGQILSCFSTKQSVCVCVCVLRRILFF
jgi:hypothetical protein